MNLKTFSQSVFFTIWASLVVPAAWGGQGVEADCSACEKKQTAIMAMEAQIQKHSDLLAANREYLTALNPKDTSQSVKIESNIMMALAKIDEIKTDVSELKHKMEKEGCESCLPQQE